MPNTDNDMNPGMEPMHGYASDDYGRSHNAPGFTIEHVDSLMRTAWIEGYSAGSQSRESDVQRARAELQNLKHNVQRIIGGQLIHISRSLKSPIRSKRTTLAQVYDHAGSQAERLDKATFDLEKLIQ